MYGTFCTKYLSDLDMYKQVVATRINSDKRRPLRGFRVLQGVGVWGFRPEAEVLKVAPALAAGGGGAYHKLDSWQGLENSGFARAASGLNASGLTARRVLGLWGREIVGFGRGFNDVLVQGLV